MTNLEFALHHKVVVIVRGLPLSSMRPLAEALYSGGIRLMEVTFNQAEPDTWRDTQSAIEMLATDFNGRILPGAGTVMNDAQLSLAESAGAAYIISPNCDPALIAETKRRGLLSFPGAFTPSEIVRAAQAGADVVKVFPAGQLGPDYIKSVRAPISHVPLMAVGGITEKNAADFIAAGCVGVGVGGSLVNKSWIERGEWGRVTALAQEYAKVVG